MGIVDPPSLAWLLRAPAELARARDKHADDRPGLDPHRARSPATTSASAATEPHADVVPPRATSRSPHDSGPRCAGWDATSAVSWNEWPPAAVPRCRRTARRQWTARPARRASAIRGAPPGLSRPDEHARSWRFPAGPWLPGPERWHGHAGPAAWLPRQSAAIPAAAWRVAWPRRPRRPAATRAATGVPFSGSPAWQHAWSRPAYAEFACCPAAAATAGWRCAKGRCAKDADRKGEHLLVPRF